MTSKSPHWEQRITRVLRYLERRIEREDAGDPTLDELAAVAFTSPYHFHRVFSAIVGEPVLECVRNMRLEHAAYRLRCTRRPVAVIARNAGYESADAFGRAFRSRFNTSPSAFRKRWFDAAGKRNAWSAPTRTFPQRKATHVAHGVSLIHAGPFHLVCLRHLGSYQTVFKAWQRLSELTNLFALDPDVTLSVGISYDDPELVPAQRVRYDACYSVASDVCKRVSESRGPEQLLSTREMPAGRYAKVTHVGPYHLLGEAYERLYCVWLPQGEWEPATEPSIEIYRSAPGTTETDLVTDILLPLVEIQPRRL